MADIFGDDLDNTLPGGSGNDSIEGRGGNDIITGGSGDDTILAGSGNDSVQGETENDSILGDAGSDTLFGGLGDDHIDGGTESDTIYGGQGSDTLLGGDGNDRISNNANDSGDDSIDGGAGNDTIEDYDGNNTISGGDGNDYMYNVSGNSIDGGDGNDTIRGYNYNRPGNNDVTITGGQGNDTIYNTYAYATGANTLSYNLQGNSGDDYVEGSSYSDTVSGDEGNDSLQGGSGNDTVYGGTGNDTLEGQNDNDELYGGSGDDVINGDRGNDTIDGGSGGETTGDVAVFSGNRANYLILDNGGSLRVVDRTGTYGDNIVMNVETLRFSDGDYPVAGLSLGLDIDGTAGPDTLIGTPGDDSIDGLGGNDSITADGGDDVVNGQSGDDTVSGMAGNDDIYGGDGNDVVTGASGEDLLVGGNGNDSLVGGSDPDVIYGGTGNDTMIGGEGNDRLGANANDSGDDSIEGGAGNDTIEDYEGNNTISGGDGNDYMYNVSGNSIDGGDGNDTIRGYNYNRPGNNDVTITGGQGNDTIYNTYAYATGTNTLSYNLHGNSGDDYVEGSSYSDSITGDEGNDLLQGHHGNDTVYGGSGDDTVQGGNNDDVLYGGSGDDSVTGDAGNDSLFGGLGTDTLIGGAGNDTIDGGTPGGGGDIVLINANRVGYTITTGAAGEATISGAEGTDVLTGISIIRFNDQDVVIGSNPGTTFNGTTGADTFAGGEGDDTAIGLSGDDTLNGNGGNDSILGGADSDNLSGGLGDDHIDGGTEADTISGGQGSDTLLGGDGNDHLSNSVNDSGDDSIDGGAGNDTIEDYEGNNTISGGDGNDYMYNVSGNSIDGGDGNDTIRGYNYNRPGNNDVTITGGQGDDTIYNTYAYATGANTLSYNLQGNSGDDYVEGSSYSDTVSGDEGNDSLQGGSGNDTVYGGTGNDTLEGQNDNDELYGGSGDDVINGDRGNDTIDGGSGGETTGDVAVFTGNRANYLILDNGGGSLRVVDRTGTYGDNIVMNVETLRFSDGDYPVAGLALGLVTAGTVGDDSLTGTPADDSITGALGNDTIDALAGNDLIEGNTGDDSVIAGSGEDDVFGGVGNDEIFGGEGTDDLFGGLGDDLVDGGTENDSLNGGQGSDTLLGGDGNDRISNSVNDSGDDSIDGGAGNDTIEDYEGDNTISGGDGNDYMYTVSGNSIDGGDGNDTIRGYNYNRPGNNDVTITGGQGDDTIYNTYAYATGANTLSYNLQGNSGDDYVEGSSYSDTVSGDEGNDSLQGGSGNDTVYGGTGNDTLEGQNDNDELYGGSGDDIFYGGFGNDTIDGGSGGETDGDIAVYTGNRDQYTITGDANGLQIIHNTLAANGGDGTDILTNIERLRFADGDVVVSTGLTGASVNGNSGNDSLVGTILNDTINGFEGNDTIVGLSGIDDIDGGPGNDTIDAGGEDDNVAAGSGDDTIRGGAGDDTIAGGPGDDRAVFSGDLADYVITGDQTAATVTGPDGTDILTDIRELQFDDQVFAFNGAPNAVADAAATNEDTFVDIPVADLLANDSDPDGDPLTISQVKNFTDGTGYLFSNASGTFVRFTPAANFSGNATFEVDVTDGFATSTSTVTVAVSPVNDAPVAVNDTAVTAEDTAVNIDVLANDSDVEDGTPTVSAVGNSANGVTGINGDGTVSFTPNANFNGVATFNYTVMDTDGATRTATVSVTVTPVNDLPMAFDDAASTYEDVPVEIDVLANDSDADGDLLSILATGAAANGTASIDTHGTADTSDDTVVYTPDSGFTGSDSFTYTVSDGNGGTDTATVTVSVGALANIITTFDSDLEGWTTINDAQGLSWVATGGNPDGHATATDVGTGATWYWSAPSAYLGNKSPFYLGSLSFDLMQSSTNSGYDNDDLRIVGANGVTLALDLAPPGADWTHYNVSLSTNSNWRIGTENGAAATQTQIAEVLADIDNIYIRGEYRSGADTGYLDNVVMSLPGAGGNVPPIAAIISAGTPEDTPVNIDVLTSAFDANGDALSVDQVSHGLNGFVTINLDGTVRYTPFSNFFGLDSFTYVISDGNGGFDTATVNINVTPVDDMPIAVQDSAATSAASPVIIDVLANDSDVEGTVSLEDAGPAGNGTLVENGDGTVTYTPNVGFTGVDTFSYTIMDETGNTDTATVSVNVIPGGVSITSAAPLVVEGDSGTTNVQFILQRSAAVASTITVEYTIVGVGFDQVGADDIVGGAFPITGTAVLNPGVANLAIDVPVQGDLTPEAHETMRFTIVSAEDENGVPIPILDAQHLVTVVNDDGPYNGGGSDDNPGTGNDGTGTPGDPNDPGAPGTGGNPGGGSSSGGNGTNNPGNGPIPNPPTPPAPPGGPGGSGRKEADVWGDPHLVTFDGARWDFQAVGEFIATMGTEAGDDFEIQVRFTAFGNSSSISSLGAIATEIDGHTVEVYRDDQIPDGGTINLLIDGVPTAIDPYAGPISVGSGEVWFDGTNGYRIIYPSGEQIMVKSFGSYMNMCVFTDDTVHPDGTTIGLLGNGDGDSGNEIVLPDGTVLENPSFQTIYGAYADAWRINDADSFFTYETGMGTADFTDTSFPRGVVQISDFPQEAIDAATAIVDAQGISNPFLRDAAILDVLISGDPGLAEASDSLAADPTTQGTPTNVPTLDAVTIATLTPFANEGDSGATTTFQFQIVRIGDTSAAVDIDWEVLAGQVDADDFGGTLPTGTASFAAGDASQTITVEVSGDDVAEFNEAFKVQITSPDGVYVAQQSQGIIVNDDGPLPSTFQIYANPYSVTEGTGTDSFVTFVITRGNSTLEEDTVTVEFSGTVDADDFDGGLFPDPRTVTFLPGEDVKFVTLQIEGDSIFEGDEPITATLTSATGGTITIPVANAIVLDDDNSAPVAGNDSVTLDEDTSVTVNVTGNDSDANGDTLSYALNTGASSGTVVDNGDGTFLYTPNANFNGTDSFTYTVSDGNGGTDTATVSVTVSAVNDDPDAQADAYSTAFNTTLNIAAPGVLTNDSDVDGDPLSVVSHSSASNGTVTQNADGSFTYTPNTGFSGTDSFDYAVSDGTTTNTATVSIVVAADTNVAPVAGIDNYTTGFNLALNVAAPGVLFNDGDANGDPLSVISHTVASNGTVSVNTDGSLTYTPDTDFTGFDSFDYTVSDGALTDTATVTVFVSPDPNVPPVAEDDTYSTHANVPLVVLAPGLLTNDSDLNGDTLDVVSFTAPSNGTVTPNPDGSFTYTPNTGFVGTDTFTYTASDGSYGDNATVTIHVENEVPVAVADSYTTAQNTTLTIAAPGLLANDTDADGDPLQVSSYSLTANGTLMQNADGSFTYTPDAGFTGTDSFEYRATDGVQFTPLTTVTIEVTSTTPVNALPVAANDSAGVLQDTPVTIDVLANDTDADGDTLAIQSYGPASNGTVTLDNNGTAGDTSDDRLDYTPDAGFTGSDSFTYSVSDGNGGNDTATVTVTVSADINQSLFGTSGSDLIEGLNGNDTLTGLAGNDSLFGGADDDVIYGGVGSDLIDGGSGNDRLIGGDAATDRIIGGDGDDTITARNDVLVFDEDDGEDRVFNFQTGSDRIELTGTGTAVFAYDATRNATTMTYGLTVVTFFGVEITDANLTGSGTPIAAPDFASTIGTMPVAIDVLANDLDTDGDPLSISSVTGGIGGTVILNDNGTLDTSDDFIDFVADAGFYGTYTFTYEVSDGTLMSTGTVQVAVVEPIAGTNGADSLAGGAYDDVISGELGDDTINGRAGNDRLDGGGDNDRIFGNAGDDTVTGGEGNDLLNGGGGDDVLEGGDGNDRLAGGAGADEVRGGDGNDTIQVADGDTLIFDTDDGDDVVFGFTSGLDQVQLEGAGTSVLTYDAVRNVSILEFDLTTVTFYNVEVLASDLI